MCGIAGLIHLDGSKSIGKEMSLMLQAMKHRGPDSTGFGLYGVPKENYSIIRLKTAEQADMSKGFDVLEDIKKRKEIVESRLKNLGAEIQSVDSVTEYAFRYVISHSGDLKKLSNYLENIEGVEILSIGEALELIKDLGDSNTVSTQYGLNNFTGTHAIGHTRMATESDIDIRSAHPYWAYPFKDVSVVHNGQLTNYWGKRCDLERKGLRFMSNCDSELIAVYLADKISEGVNLEDAMRTSVDELDGVFTYLVATSDSLGMAKDTMAAKPMVLMETDTMIVMASEEMAIREIYQGGIDSYDPYEGEVKVWKKN